MSNPPTASPASKLGGAGIALLTRKDVISLFVAGCAWLVPDVNTGLVGLNPWRQAGWEEPGKRCWRETSNLESEDNSLSSLSRLHVACGSSLLSRLASSTGRPLRLPLLGPCKQDSGWLLVLLVLRAFGVWEWPTSYDSSRFLRANGRVEQTEASSSA
jgi:hypothetical protein